MIFEGLHVDAFLVVKTLYPQPSDTYTVGKLKISAFSMFY
jgi:hypothetical protein